jgi:LAO/AO transport system kinase
VTRREDPEALLAAARAGDRGAVARLISLVERGGETARAVGRLVFPLGGAAFTVGITGPPGSGKSTLTSRLIGTLRAAGSEVGVLAVDPSSPFTGGALLGDRVRMQDHALDAGVFVRSMATRGHLGGLALATPEAVRVLDAVGIPVVLVETVGVGQVEVEIAGAADTTIVVVNPGAGDSIQANKAGLFEVADLFVINKADRPGAREAERDLQMMLDIDPLMGAWRPPVLQTVASDGTGVAELWAAVEEHRRFLIESGRLAERRRKRAAAELREIVVRQIELRATRRTGGQDFDRILDAVLARDVDPYSAAEEILATLGL